MDFYAASGQKWLTAGTGTGDAYFKRDLLPKVWSDMTISPFSPVVENDDLNMHASKFERSGQRHIPSLRGMGDAIDFHNAIASCPKTQTNSRVLPPSSVATPYLNANVSWPACVGERH